LATRVKAPHIRDPGACPSTQKNVSLVLTSTPAWSDAGQMVPSAMVAKTLDHTSCEVLQQRGLARPVTSITPSGLSEQVSLMPSPVPVMVLAEVARLLSSTSAMMGQAGKAAVWVNFTPAAARAAGGGTLILKAGRTPCRVVLLGADRTAFQSRDRRMAGTSNEPRSHAAGL
jgi:hypothetical protein